MGRRSPVPASTGSQTDWNRQVALAVNNPVPGAVDFKAFGGNPDGVTDNYALMLKAVESLGDRGGVIYIPEGRYYFSAQLVFTKRIVIRGDGWGYNPGLVNGTSYSGANVYCGTVLMFPADVGGFKFLPFTDNNADSIAYEYQSALGSSVRDIMLYSAGGTGITSHGIERRCVVNLDNVRIQGFAGYGLYTQANSLGAVPWGSVDGSVARLVSCRENKLTGIFTTGDDANANHFDTCDSATNGGVGFLDKSVLGNTYTVCHAATNNKSYGTPAGYSAAQRTQNTTDWAGLSDEYAGSYVTTGAVAAHKFDGCYVEIGFGRKHEVVFPAIISGGYLANMDRTAAAAASPCRIDDQSTTSGLDTINTRNAGLTVTDNLTANPASGNASIKVRGAGTFSSLQIYPNNSSANGLDILAGSASAYYSADTQIIRNAAQSVTFGTWNSNGLNLGSGKAYYVNGTQVVGARGAAVTAPTGGATVDAESRTAINALISRLQAHGLIS